MKVALVHDDLMQWGGAERVLYELSEIFPEAPIYVSIYNQENKIIREKFKNKKIITSFLQKMPLNKKLYKAFLPFYPLAFELFEFDQYDVVISQTTRFAKSIITKPEVKHISYVHTPPRFLWHFSDEVKEGLLNPYFSFLRIFDQIAAKRVDFFLAGSKNAQERIKKVYQSESKILYPFVDEERFNNLDSFDGDYYLVIARLNKYKKIDVVVDVFNSLKKNLKIIGTGPEINKLKLKANNNIEFLGSLDEDVLDRVISGCKGLIVCAEEDFGLTPLEAQAMGKGVIAFGKGGALETIIENKTGVFFSDQSFANLKEAIIRFENLTVDPKQCIANAKRFSKEKFRKDLLNYIENYVI